MLTKEELNTTLQGLIIIRAAGKHENGETAAHRTINTYMAARRAGYNVDAAIDITTAAVLAEEETTSYKAAKQAKFENRASAIPERFDVPDNRNNPDTDDLILAMSEHEKNLHNYMIDCKYGVRKYNRRVAQSYATKRLPHDSIMKLYGVTI